MAHDQPIRCWHACMCPCGVHVLWNPHVWGRTRKSGGRVTRTDHLRALRQSISRRVNHQNPAGFMLFLERCPRFLSWMADTEARRKIGEELEAKWAREAQAESVIHGT